MNSSVCAAAVPLLPRFGISPESLLNECEKTECGSPYSNMRKYRGMTQSQLADEMGVSQSYISQIENGQKQLVSLLTDYAQEVGARIKYEVEPAEKKPNGNH